MEVRVAAAENLVPDRFVFWQPPAGYTVCVGADQRAVPLPESPLPIHTHDLTGATPSDAAIGQGCYDYLRQFPDCVGNRIYAELLRDAFPHFLSDLAAQAVMIDAKRVDSAYVLRKLVCLKILHLLEPQNRGLLQQLGRGYFELALEFSELARCRQHLQQAIRYGQDLLSLVPDDPFALSLLAEIDLFFGDTPAAREKLRRLADQVDDPLFKEKIEHKLAASAVEPGAEASVVDDLEAMAEAMHCHATGNNEQAVYLLERIEEQGRLTSLLPSADFFWLLGVCRHGCGDGSGALVALQRALELEPDHAPALEALASL